MGVFFPAQQLKSAFAPEDSYQVDVKVSRAKASGDAIVPVKVYGNEDDYFFVSPIEFLDGQTETNCTIFFSKDMPLGVEYKLTVAIEDPSYASKYNKNASFISVPVVIENYKLLGKAEFFDNFMFNNSYMVDICQNVMNPAEFRLLKPYDEGLEKEGYIAEGAHKHEAVQKLNFRILQPGEVLFKGTSYEVTIKNEDGIFYDAFYTGFYHPSYGAEVIAYHPSDFSSWSTEESWSHNKVVNYQDPDAEGNVLPAVVQLAPYYYMDGIGGWSYCDNDGAVLIRFPGGNFVDYAFGISTEECKGGQSPITFSLGKDVAAVKYLVYPGELSSKEIRQETALIGAGEKAAEDLDINLPRIFVTCEETGLYTIIAVAFDKNGVQQASASTVFGYVKPGDEEDVAIVFDAALEKTPQRYEKDGYTDINSVLAYIVGDDVSLVRYKIMTSKDYEANPDSVANVVKTKGTLLGEDELEAVNEPGGYVFLQGKLAPLTSYTIVAYGYNGFTGKTIVKSITTSGLPMQKVGTGKYSYNIITEAYGVDPFIDEVDLYFDPNTTDEYNIPDWWEKGCPVNFTKKDTAVTITTSYIGDGLYMFEFHDFIDEYAAAAGVTPEYVCQFYDSTYGLDLGEYYKNGHSFYDPVADIYYFCVMFAEGNYDFYSWGYETLSMSKAAAGVTTKKNLVLDSCNRNGYKAMKSDLHFDYRLRIPAQREINAVEVNVKNTEAVATKAKAALRKITSK